jgi:hypothetical protein
LQPMSVSTTTKTTELSHADKFAKTRVNLSN